MFDCVLGVIACGLYCLLVGLLRLACYFWLLFACGVWAVDCLLVVAGSRLVGCAV